MKQVTYIEFKSGWRPPAYATINIVYVCTLKKCVSKNGNEYNLNLGTIADDDAIVLALKDPYVKLRNV